MYPTQTSTRVRRLICLLAALLSGWLWRCPAQAPATNPSGAAFSGYWEGDITLPQTALVIRVDLARTNQTYSGTIDIPVQNLRGFSLGSLRADDRSITFAMPGIPGDPTFEGQLAPGGKRITGHFRQGGQSFPFQLNSKPRPVPLLGQTPAKGIPGTGLNGNWQASLTVAPGMQLRLLLEITNTAQGNFEGVMISLDQGNARIPCTATTNVPNRVQLKLPTVGSSFTGELSADGSELQGQWRQGASSLPLAFKRLAKPLDVRRPQDPVKPYPYLEEEVSIPNPKSGIVLAGTLTIPSTTGPHPAVILLTGSGPQDRDESIAGHRPFLVLADALTRGGIAVLRMDDRGVGKSGGTFSTATHEDFVGDALAGVQWLEGRTGIDRKRIGLIGHSEGGVVAPLVAKAQPNSIAFLVLMAGVGIPLDELLVQQGMDLGRVAGADEALLTRNAKIQRDLFQLIRQTPNDVQLRPKIREILDKQLSNLTPEQRESLHLNEKTLNAQAEQLASPWFRTLVGYTPAQTFAQIHCPVLALNGGKDLQVAAKPNLEGIRQGLALAGNSAVETVEFPGLNHLFQPCTTGALSEYAEIEQTIAPQVLVTIRTWIQKQSSARKPSF